MKLSESEQRTLDQRIQLNMDIQENQLFRSQEARRLSLGRERKWTLLLGLGLVALYVLSVLFTCNVLMDSFGLSRVAEQLKQRTNDIVDLCLGNPLSTGIHFFLTQFAAPVVVGMALAGAGACYQGLFHNPMASPTLLGVTSGGMLGSTIYLLFFSNLSAVTLAVGSYGGVSLTYANMSLFDRYVQQLFVMGGCFLVVLGVLVLAKISGRGKVDTVALMLGGTVFTTTVNSILSLAVYILGHTGQGSAASNCRMYSASFGAFEGRRKAAGWRSCRRSCRWRPCR